MHYQLNDIAVQEIFPGLRGKMVHTERMTLAFWEVSAGALVPEHQHEHEQVMHVLEGDFEFTLEGYTQTYQKGDLVVIGPNKWHSGKALTDCKLMDVFSPTRTDYQLK